ncbi:MAG: DUF3226 domain-containing protein [Imperialibacter sp.]|uniref:DUF3226 domain-containing protein n=1 Tax=Imperialibacter sp. TaxID=2038411 RepID=UPI0032EBC6AF
MSAVTIFVEGSADAKFIKDLVAKYYQIDLIIKADVQFFKGKDNWYNIAPDFRKSTLENKTNLLIFDADDTQAIRREGILAKGQELGLSFEVFLLPDGNGSGDLESLLEMLIPEAKKSIIHCFESYESCLAGLNFEVFPNDRKTKIYAYVKSLAWLKKKRDDPDPAKEGNRDYLDDDIWDLDNNALSPLLNFLSPYFENQ